MFKFLINLILFLVVIYLILGLLCVFGYMTIFE